jgi:hypothetical protein
MRRAWNSARSVLRAGGDLDSAMSEIKRVSAFNDEKGQMRPNLYAQLEDWGVHRYLGHPSGASLFAAGWSDIQTTSLLPFPTFSDDRNYEGKAPSPLKHPVLRSLILDRFVPLLSSMPSALLLPLGVTVERIVRELYALGVIANPCAFGLLHPSGQNTYRLKYLCGPRTGPVPGKTNVATYDCGKQAFRVRHLQNAS